MLWARSTGISLNQEPLLSDGLSACLVIRTRSDRKLLSGNSVPSPRRQLIIHQDESQKGIHITPTLRFSNCQTSSEPRDHCFPLRPSFWVMNSLLRLGGDGISIAHHDRAPLLLLLLLQHLLLALVRQHHHLRWTPHAHCRRRRVPRRWSTVVAEQSAARDGAVACTIIRTAHARPCHRSRDEGLGVAKPPDEQRAEGWDGADEHDSPHLC